MAALRSAMMKASIATTSITDSGWWSSINASAASPVATIQAARCSAAPAAMRGRLA